MLNIWRKNPKVISAKLKIRNLVFGPKSFLHTPIKAEALKHKHIIRWTEDKRSPMYGLLEVRWIDENGKLNRFVDDVRNKGDYSPVQLLDYRN